MGKYINSKNVAYLIAVIILVVHYYVRTFNYNNWQNILGWDVLSYYLYLPFTFIYHDPGMTDQSIIKHIFEVYNPSSTFYQAYQLPNGHWASMYTLGFALVFMPFFFIGHLWAILGGYPADGFSFPYQFAIGNGLMIYIVAGVFVIRKVLLHFFNDRTTMIVLILMLLGTNYFQEAIAEESMPHATLFTAYALIIYLTIKWHNKQTYKTAALLGLLMGFTILARASEILCLFIPVFWNVYNKQTLIEKWQLIKKNFKQLLVLIAFFMITPLIQMIFWKYNTGSFIFFSYQNTEGFDWLQPHIVKVLFSYKKSWFLYTPLIIFAIIGFYNLYKRKREIFWPSFLFFIANFYMLASWAAWWQGGSFGMRYYVESYAVMTLPLGFFITSLLERKIWLKLSVGLALAFFVFLNLFQTWQFNNWIIDGYAMTKAYYWKVFLKTKVNPEDLKLREIIRDFKSEEEFGNPQDYDGRTIAYMNFDSINSVNIDSVFKDTTVYKSPPYSCKLTKDHPFSPTFRMPFNQITKREHAWIRVSFDYYPVHDLKESPASMVVHFDHSGRFTLKYKGFDLEWQPYKLNQWNHMVCDYLTPYPLSDDDKLVVYFWLRSDKDIYIDNMQVEAFERKW